MGTIAKEDGVLKLVHPGRFVEIHKKPITAAEVLKRNPRHSVTRTDVFQYPWVVVSRESVLNLGKVFFIVPNRTIYQLLKAHKERHQHSPPQSQSLKNHVHQQLQNQNSPQKSSGVITKHRNNHQWLMQSLSMPSCISTTSQEQDFDKRLRKQSKVESWPKLISKNRKTLLELEEKSVEDSTVKIGSSHHKGYHLHQHSPPQSQSLKNHVHQQLQNQNSPQKSSGVITKHRNNHQWLMQSLSMPSCISTTSQEQDFDKRLRKQSKVESWPKLISKNRKTLLELEEKSMEDSTVKIESSHHKGYHLVDTNIIADLPKKNDGDLECKYRKDLKEVTTLKSCLRKKDSVRNLLQLRVSFFLPTKDAEQHRRVKASQT